MKYFKIKPNSKLTNVVKHFWVLEVESGDLPFQQINMPYNWFELYWEIHIM